MTLAISAPQALNPILSLANLEDLYLGLRVAVRPTGRCARKPTKARSQSRLHNLRYQLWDRLGFDVIVATRCNCDARVTISLILYVEAGGVLVSGHGHYTHAVKMFKRCGVTLRSGIGVDAIVISSGKTSPALGVPDVLESLLIPS